MLQSVSCSWVGVGLSALQNACKSNRHALKNVHHLSRGHRGEQQRKDITTKGRSALWNLHLWRSNCRGKEDRHLAKAAFSDPSSFYFPRPPMYNFVHFQTNVSKIFKWKLQPHMKLQYLLCTPKEYILVRKKRIRGPHIEQSFSLMCLFFRINHLPFWGRQLSSSLVDPNHTFNAKSGQFSCGQIRHFAEIEVNVMKKLHCDTEFSSCHNKVFKSSGRMVKLQISMK